MAAKRAKAGRFTKWAAIPAAVALTGGAIGLSAKFNIEAMAAKGPLYAALGIALAIGSAFFVHLAYCAHDRTWKVLFGAVAAICLYASFTNTTDSARAVSAAQADTLNTQVSEHEHFEKDLTAAETKYNALVAQVGYSPLSSFETALNTAQSADKWQGQECPNEKHRDEKHRPDRKPCLDAKLAISKATTARDNAKARDDAEKDVKTARANLNGAPNPHNQAGKPSAGNETSIALAVETIAAFTPVGCEHMLIVLGVIGAFGGGGASRPVATERPRRRPLFSLRTRKTDDSAEAYPLGSAREFHRRYLEPSGPNDRVAAGNVQKRYRDDCARAGVDPLDEKALSQQLQACGVTYSKTKGGRPYYYGVKFRDVPLPIVATTPARQAPRLAVDNTVQALAV